MLKDLINFPSWKKVKSFGSKDSRETFLHYVKDILEDIPDIDYKVFWTMIASFAKYVMEQYGTGDDEVIVLDGFEKGN